jgi:hypothetical protein
MCQFSSGKWFFCTKFVYLALACKFQLRANCIYVQTQLCTPKKNVINWTRLRLNISDRSIIMFGRGCLLLIVPRYMEFPSQFYRWGCQNKTAKLRHLIFWAPVEMLSQSIKRCKALWKTKCLHAWAFHFLNSLWWLFPLSETLWVPIGYPSPFMGKPLFLKKLCWSLHSISPLEWSSFESKDPS